MPKFNMKVNKKRKVVFSLLSGNHPKYTRIGDSSSDEFFAINYDKLDVKAKRDMRTALGVITLELKDGYILINHTKMKENLELTAYNTHVLSNLVFKKNYEKVTIKSKHKSLRSLRRE